MLPRLFVHPRAQIMLLALVSITFLTACPTRSQIDSAAQASRELSHDTVATEKVVKALYQNGRLSLERKDFLAGKLKFIATEGTHAQEIIATLNQQDKEGKLPANAGMLIRENFAPIFSAFTDLMVEIGKLPPAEAGEMESATKDLSKHMDAIQKVSSQ